MRTQVLYYPDLSNRPDDHLLDAVVRAERRSCDSPALAAPIHLGDIMELSGIGPSVWKAYVLETHGFDLAEPDEAALRRLLPHANDVAIAALMDDAQDNADTWSLPESDLWRAWEIEEGRPQAVTCGQAWAVVQETGGKGLAFLAYMDEVDSIRASMSSDNEISISPSNSGDGAMIGLVDTVNGTGHFVLASGRATYRPAARGAVLVGTNGLADTFGISADAFPHASVEFHAAEPVQMSSRSEELSNFAPPEVDLSAIGSISPTP